MFPLFSAQTNHQPPKEIMKHTQKINGIRLSDQWTGIILGLAFGCVVQAAEINWNPPVSGSGGSISWSNDLNWSGGEVPGSTDIAVFGGTTVYNFQPQLNAFRVDGVQGLKLGGASTVGLTLSAGSGTKTVTELTAAGVTELKLDDVSYIVVGQSISGTRIQLGTFVTGVDLSTNTITISRPTSGGTITANSVMTLTSSLEVGSSGISLLAGTPNVSNIITAPILLTANQNWHNGTTNRSLQIQGVIDLGNHTLTLSGEAGSTISFNGVSGTQSIAGTGDIVIDTNGTVSFGPGTGGRQINSFSGGVTLNSGRIELQGGNAGGTGSMGGLGTGVLTINGGELRGNGNIAGKPLTISGQVWNADWAFVGNRTIDMGTGGITLGTATGTSRTLFANGGVYVLTLGGGIADGSTANQFIVDGSSRIQLTGASTYTGGTFVRGATLQVDNTSGSGTGSGLVSVENNGTLMGTGSIDGGVNIQAGSTLTGTLGIGGDSTIAGIHSPGNSPGIQEFAGNLSYTSGASVVWELVGNTNVNAANPNAIFDTVNVAGDLSFDGPTTLNLVFNLAGSDVDWTDDFWSADRAGTDGWLLYQVGGSLSGFSNLSLSSIDWQDSNNAALSSVRSLGDFGLHQDGNNIYITYAIPEPGTLLLLGIAGLALGLFGKRRRG